MQGSLHTPEYIFESQRMCTDCFLSSPTLSPLPSQLPVGCLLYCVLSSQSHRRVAPRFQPCLLWNFMLQKMWNSEGLQFKMHHFIDWTSCYELSFLKWNPSYANMRLNMLLVMIHCTSTRKRSSFPTTSLVMVGGLLWLNLSHTAKCTFSHHFISHRTAVFGLQPRPSCPESDFSIIHTPALCCKSFLSPVRMSHFVSAIAV